MKDFQFQFFIIFSLCCVTSVPEIDQKGVLSWFDLVASRVSDALQYQPVFFATDQFDQSLYLFIVRNFSYHFL